MSAPVGLLLLGLISCLATICALYRTKLTGGLMVLYFFTAWLQGELAVFHIVWQSILALWLILARGALSTGYGVAGLILLLMSFVGLRRFMLQSLQTGSTFDLALRDALGAEYRHAIPESRRSVLRDTIDWREWMKPFSFRRPGVRVVRGLPYGPAGKRNLLDLYIPDKPRDGGFPVLLQIHGGAWMIGNKQQQGLPLMNHLAQRGWLCVSINYRLSPGASFPAHIEDSKLALAWIKQRIGEFGGNPDFVAITGGSAGGHLCALAALTPNRAELQPGVEHVDTTVQAAVPFYGVYDWLDESGSGGIATLRELLVRWVIKAPEKDAQELWFKGRPLAQVNSDAPPMLIVHGSHDSLVWVEDARHFVEALRAVSQNPVAYAELTGAQHAFEIFHSIRCDYSLNGVAEFLEWSHARWLNAQQSTAESTTPRDRVSSGT